jgi:hypothetical protein
METGTGQGEPNRFGGDAGNWGIEAEAGHGARGTARRFCGYTAWKPGSKGTGSRQRAAEGTKPKAQPKAKSQEPVGLDGCSSSVEGLVQQHAGD